MFHISAVRSQPHRAWALVAIFALTLALAACSKKTEGPSPTGQTGERKAPAAGTTGGGDNAAKEPAGDNTATRQLLQMVPADAATVGAVLDWPRFYQLLGDLERTLNQTDLGKMLVKQTRLYSQNAPVPAPWTLDKFKELGLDPEGPMAVFGRDEPVVVFSLKNGPLFKKNLAAMWGKGKASWTPRKVGRHQLEMLSGQRTIHCTMAGRQLICSTDEKALIAAVDRSHPRSLWDTLSEDQRAELVQATGLLAVRSGELSGQMSLRVLDDGAVAQVRVSGPTLKRVVPLLGAKGPGTLLGLAKDADTVVYLRSNISGLLRMARGVVPSPRELGLDAVRMHAALTGEVLLVERPRGKAMMVVGSRDPKLSAAVVEALGERLSKRAKARGSALKVTPVLRNEGKLYRVEVDATADGMPFKLDLGLAAAPAGILVGSFGLVEKEWQRTPPAPSVFLDALKNPRQKEAFAAGTVLASRSPLGDPLGPLAATVATLLRSGLGAKAELAVKGLQMGRFLLDQMNAQTIGVAREGAQGLRLTLHLATLHRRGNADDDKARELWQEALTARDAGQSEAYRKALATLADTYPDTRYGQLKARSETPSLLGTLLTSSMMATAVPAFMRYRQRSQLSEARRNLARIASAARVAHQSTRAKGAGKVTFPPTTPWSPRTPCCKGKDRTCPPDPKVWEHPGWRALLFSIPRPHRFQYRFVNRGKSFVAQARGDLTCSGKGTVYTLEGKVDERGEIKLEPVRAVEER